ncbi:MAG TPA: hypothetical protein VJ576_13895 [Rhodocyclaceae bacterium]|nr:hypothetical protein [Rhodocyclaceae bacterium]
MARNRVFTKRDIDGVVGLINTWPNETISWNEVRDKVTPLLGFKPSRQGLNQHERVLTAFQSKKAHLRISPKQTSPMPSSLAVAAKRIANLLAENKRLELINKEMKDRFRTWQYNAHVFGMSEADLDKPLPLVDKDVAASEKDEYGRVK